MKDRILVFLQNENKSYAQFAEEIGVQPSGISHILSGRNNPSLDFVIKMLHRYPSLSAEWLLFGREPMYRSVAQPTLFEMDIPADRSGNEEGPVNDGFSPDDNLEPDGNQAVTGGFMQEKGVDGAGRKKLLKIVMFYSDKTFTEYTPS
jgi:transcriptional regulator with XRE-family HTH domain